MSNGNVVLSNTQKAIVTYGQMLRVLDSESEVDEEHQEISDPFSIAGKAGKSLSVDFYHGRLDPEQDMDGWGEDVLTLTGVRKVDLNAENVTLVLGDDTQQVFEWHSDMVVIQRGGQVWYCGDFSVSLEACTSNATTATVEHELYVALKAAVDHFDEWAKDADSGSVEAAESYLHWLKGARAALAKASQVAL